jgi:hypothetical protein
MILDQKQVPVLTDFCGRFMLAGGYGGMNTAKVVFPDASLKRKSYYFQN